jgi:hypothetical protein
MTFLAPTGSVGSGFVESSFRSGLERGPAFIGADAGSTDAGPYKLGGGLPTFSRAACARDLRTMLRGARQLDVPLMIGSAGGAGGDRNLEWMQDILLEVAREEGLHFRLATIAAEQSKDAVKSMLRQGRIDPLDPAPPIDEDVIDGCEHIVAMMGVEPFQQALEAGADVVLAGRSSDTSIFAALPVARGMPAGLSWHAAKILECGAAAATHRFTPDGMICELREDGFVIEPLNPGMRCTPLSVASHSLYENGDPYRLLEPGGYLDTSAASYVAVSDRAVEVSGSTFVPTQPYTVKLEGAALAGYQSAIIAGVRDPVIIEQLDSWLDSLLDRVRDRVDTIYGQPMRDEYALGIRVYGRDAVMGPLEPTPKALGHEVGLLFTVTAQTQELAHSIAATTGHMGVHHPVPEWNGLISGLAFPFAPYVFDRGPVYRFTLNHVLRLDDPLEPFRICLEEV